MLRNFIQNIPKAELHLHIEGSLEPELMFKIAERNGIKTRFKTVDALRNAYQFNNLQEYLDIYYEGASVLLNEQDFYDMTWAYLERIKQDNVIHTEIFLDPQTHTDRGISFETVIKGIYSALMDAEEKLGITSKIIMCFVRHLDEAAALETLEKALPYKDWIYGVGLASSELGNPPSKFERVFKKAVEHGFLTVAHAGEEGPAEYVWEALDLLKVSRIDHGNRSMDDAKLVARLCKDKIPLTVCPLSNLKLQVVKDLKKHPIREMLQAGLVATINSDDPAYFGGYINQNYLELAEAADLTKAEIVELVRNSFIGSFLTSAEKEVALQKVDSFCENWKD